MCLLIGLVFSFSLAGKAQIQAGSVYGTVADAHEAFIQNATIVLRNDLTGFYAATTTDMNGDFAFKNVPFAPYRLEIQAQGFAPVIKQIAIRSVVPVRRHFSLAVGEARADVLVEAAGDPTLGPWQTSSATQLSEKRLNAVPNVVRSHALQRIIASAAGVTTQNNGLLHVRGAEDGILYVAAGVPTADRIDAVSASSFDIGTVRSVQVITGNFPAEFGGRSAAVAIVTPRTGLDEELRGELTASLGNVRTADAAGSLGYGWRKRVGIFAAAAANRSDRFLDPVDERNYNNRGSRRNLSFRVDWRATAKDRLAFDLGLNGSDLRVPNDLEQELAGQRQRQELRDDNQSIAWQRTWNNSTATDLVWFRRSYHSSLFPSEFDIPISATQDRSHSRMGAIGSVSHVARGHFVKAGVEFHRISVRESFTFAITDVELADDREISKPAQAFTRDNPFVFQGARNGGYFAAYFQDEFSPFSNLNVSAGLRYDRSELPATESQLSPRIGIAYFVPRTGTVFRASFNRLFQPPQLENLLLSNSEQARALSPFLSDTGGGERVRPERISAYEIGAAQLLWDLIRFDTSFWWRNFRDHSDPNTFFNTTVVFQNSVHRGFSRGVDVRLDMAERRGFSGYLSYTNSRILQTGPINGGLFLTDEFIEIGPGTRFIPDHDQRNVASFAVTYNHRRHGWFVTFGGRHESGVPLEVEEERLEELRHAPGADLVNFDRRRVRPRSVFDLRAGLDLHRTDRRSLRFELNVRNVFDSRFAYNFGSAFEGTHFGHPRLVGGRLTFDLR